MATKKPRRQRASEKKLSSKSGMTESKHNANVTTYRVAGHTVEIRRIQDREELRIDQVRTGYFKTEDGYSLDAAAYDPPYKSLLDAVKSFLHPREGGSERK